MFFSFYLFTELGSHSELDSPLLQVLKAVSLGTVCVTLNVENWGRHMLMIVYGSESFIYFSFNCVL